MDDFPNNTEYDSKTEIIPSRKLGAFEFMSDHLFDLVVIVKTSEEDPNIVRRVELYYAEKGMVSSFVFDRASRKYTANTQKALQAAMDQLMKEVKSRSLSHQAFAVWYYSESDRDLVQRQASYFAEGNRTLTRYLDVLHENARVIPDSQIY